MRSTDRALLQCFRPSVDAIRADLEAVAAQHGAADPRAAAREALNRHGGPLATLLCNLRTTAAREALAQGQGNEEADTLTPKTLPVACPGTV